jgi:hypothetical protein
MGFNECKNNLGVRGHNSGVRVVLGLGMWDLGFGIWVQYLLISILLNINSKSKITNYQENPKDKIQMGLSLVL